MWYLKQYILQGDGHALFHMYIFYWTVMSGKQSKFKMKNMFQLELNQQPLTKQDGTLDQSPADLSDDKLYLKYITQS